MPRGLKLARLTAMDQALIALRDAGFKLFADARDASQWEVAYYALCATLHAAESLEDEHTCTFVEMRANECRDWIDLHAPSHKLATRSAQARGHEGIYRQLAVTAESARLRILSLKQQGRPKAPLAAAKS